MIIDSEIPSTLSTYIDALNQTTNYRLADLSLQFIIKKMLLRFPVPSTLDLAQVSSAEIQLTTKTIVGDPTINVKSAVVDYILDYRYITWLNYNNASPWVLPGGDYIEDTVHEAQNVTHTVNGTSKILATNGLLNGLSSSFKKSGNMDFILWTESSGGNCTYYNVSTPQKPILLISLKDSTPNRSGKTTSVISIPSL